MEVAQPQSERLNNNSVPAASAVRRSQTYAIPMRDRSTTIVGQLCSFAILIRPARANLPGRLIEGAGTAPLPVITSAALRDTQDVNVLGTKIGCAFALRSGYRCAKRSKLHDGRVAEWFKAPVLKTGVPARVPWVRIPPLPPCCFYN